MVNPVKIQYYYLKSYLLKIGIPLIILVALLLSFIYSWGDRSDHYMNLIVQIGHGFFMTAGLWLGCITIVNWLWRKYPWEVFPRKHLFIEIALIMVYTMAFSTLMYFLERYILGYAPEVNIVFDSFITLLITFFITALHEAYFFYKQWQLNFSKSVKLEKENIEANYEALKNQINPHFLFNSLNSLTSLVDEKPDAVNYISDLSDFLRYLLNTNEKDLVNLEEEIEISKKYIRLQENRFGKSLKVEFSIENRVLSKLLPPLVLQMLLENAIKHNIISKDNDLIIRIYNEADLLCIENNLNKKKSVYSTGKGLKNIRERYSLFTTREIEISESNSIFLIKVPLLSIGK